MSQPFGDYLRLVGVRHILASPFHPQTSGYGGEINQVPHEMPSELRQAIGSFVEYYNHHLYHEGLGNVTPFDVYMGRHLEDVMAQKGGTSTDNPTPKRLQSEPQRASSPLLIKPKCSVLKCLIFAD